MTRPTVAVVGTGDVGSSVLRNLALSGEIGELWGLDLDAERARVAVEDAAAIASYTGRAPRVAAKGIDVLSPEQLAGVLDAIEPDLVVQTATLQSWWVITQLPIELWKRLEHEARFGPWLPFHLLPAMNVMAAVAQTPVVNVAFPDAVNAVLGAIGTAPACGAGNSDLLRPGLRLAAAEQLGVAPEDVELEWIGHHYHVVYYWMQLAEVERLDPDSFHLRVRLDGEDVTDRVDAGQLLAAAGNRLPRGRLIGERTAASAAKNARLLLREVATDDHTAAPNGLIGGYDVRFKAGTVQLRLPDGVDADEAARITQRAQLGDGISAIEDDGSVRFTAEAHAAMRDILGYDCEVLHPDEAAARVDELRAKLREAMRE